MQEPREPGQVVLDLGLQGRKKILVVEDEKNIASLIEDVLSEEYEVVLAHAGDAAVAKAQWNKPDVILMDIMMPGMNGYEVVRALQGDEKTRDIPVVAMTAKAFDDSTVSMIKNEANVKGFLRKPFQGEDLRRKVAQALAGERVFEAAPAPATAAPPAAAAPAAVPASHDFSPPPQSRRPVPMGGEASHPPASRAGGRPLRTVLWTFAAAAAALACAEAFLRFSEGRRSRPDADPPLRRAVVDGLPFSPAPSSLWTRRGVEYRTNSLGLRDREAAIPKPSGTYRLLVLGGTEVFGDGVPQDGTAARLLEAALRDRPPAGYSDAEVLNGGLWGYSPEDQWAFYVRAEDGFRPDALAWVCRPDGAASFDPGRLKTWLALPSWAAAWTDRSRVLSRMKRAYLKAGDAQDRTVPPDLLPRARAYAASRGTKLHVFVPQSEAETPPGARALDLDAFFDGAALSAEGHAALARTIFETVAGDGAR
ncbi:MAG: response regulator [Elusimicrobiota bacterium]